MALQVLLRRARAVLERQLAHWDTRSHMVHRRVPVSNKPLGLRMDRIRGIFPNIITRWRLGLESPVGMVGMVLLLRGSASSRCLRPRV